MKKFTSLILISLLFILITGCLSAKSDEHSKHEHHHNEEKVPLVSDKKEVSQIDIGATVRNYHQDNITGKGIKIAILDTGIDTKNDDLTFEKGINFVGNNSKNFQDDNGHGTKVAGIIAARKNNKNLIGIAPESKLYIAKVSDRNGKVSYSDLIKGINWAIKERVDVINISLEFEKDNAELHKAIKKAYDNNIIIISSSGNIRFEGDTYESYPGKYKEVISIGMLNTEGTVYSKEFTNKHVDVFAPGEDLTSSYFNNKMTLDTGVSFATAYASGYASLIIQSDKEKNNSISLDTVKRQMKNGLEQGISNLSLEVFVIGFLNIITIILICGLVLYHLWFYFFKKKTIRKYPKRTVILLAIMIICINLIVRISIMLVNL
ncbi:S8 family serine peptidase [Bacillus haynesii]|uniref:S8 family serine peptidase n=1 Tax=Bacillus haynesii TaxID=1925021 RepID=A0AA90EYG6_9BACI|nr:S8 family serine peptidase [Bacillus haynesii]MCY7791670.1 S8 family serine peptidase [Bacillus haynesii]MCY7912978.1 S8 family serine peptidase [Bacillus haynesii]MCY7927182.1 S8 family serine peptidase [Bacillus haynesii]MCY8771917.1 S8 family serine peptidase [Bacillus haynesii]MCY9282134.1 S8 family serine peptidase [Bacillus haynesii]